MQNSLAEKLETWGFEENAIVFKDGSLGTGLELSPIDISCLTDQTLNDLKRKFCDFLNALPAGMSVQVVQEIFSGNNQVIEIFKKLQAPGTTALSQFLTEQRASILLDRDQKGQIPKHKLYVFLRLPMSALSKKRKGFRTLFDVFRKKDIDGVSVTEAKLKSESAGFNRKIEDIISGLSGLQIKARKLESQEIFDLMYYQWNPDRPVPPSLLNEHDGEDIRDRVVMTDVVPNDLGFDMGSVKHRLISLKIQPDQTCISMAESLKDLPFDSRLFLTMDVLDQAKEIANLKTERRVTYAMVMGKKGVSDLESEAKLKDIDSLLETMVAGSERIFKVSLNILLRSSSEEVLEDQVSETLQKIRDLSGAEGMVETLASFELFSKLAIPNARSNERIFRMNTAVLSDFLPLFGSWEGHDIPRVLLRNTSGGLFKFDPFSGSLTNFNQIISGSSGSGKSFFANLIINQMLKENPKIFILDVGGSYEKTCANLGGQYIPLGMNSNISINPFDMDGMEEAMGQKVKFVTNLVELMTKEEDNKSIGRLEKAEVEKLVQHLIQEDQEPSLTKLQNLMQAHPDPVIQRTGRILSSWTLGSPYGKFVDQKTNIELKSQIVCFDLKGLETHPELQSVFLFLITDLVWREVQKDKGKYKFVLFDEVWRLLENEAGSKFLSEVFRTFRKYNASSIAISQTVEDFTKSKIAGAILPNSSVKWILRQKGTLDQTYRDNLGLNETEIGLISSLKSEKGQYSEAFLMSEDQRQVVRIESIPLEYWLGTSDAKDLAEIQKVTAENPNLTTIEVLKQLSATYPQGVARKVA